MACTRPCFFARLPALACSVWLVIAAAGCGSAGTPTGDTAAQPESASSDEPQTSASAGAVKPQAASQSSARVDADGRKWLGDIPYDVWFDNPLAVAANSQQVATTAAPDGIAAVPTTAPPTETPTTEPAPAPAGGATDWKSLIPPQIVEAEGKKLRTRLASRLKSLGEYNRTYLEVQWEGATMAGLGVIAGQHSEPIAWKDRAKYVRELGMQIQNSAESPGKKSFDPAQVAFEKFIAIMDGNTPAELPEAADEVPFSDETISRGGLMRRMEMAFEYLRKNIITEERFSSEAESVAHETAVLAAFTKAAASPGYVYTDEDEYKRYAREMLEAVAKMQQSIQAKNFAGFSEGLGVVQNKCNECHTNGGYRNN